MSRVFTASVMIAAPIERAWAVLADLERWSGWTPTVTRVTPLDGGAPREGARYRVEQPKLAPAVYTITSWRAPHAFTWVMRSPGIEGVADHTLTVLDGGGCRLELRVEFRGLLAGLVAAMAGTLTQQYIETEASSLKSKAEAQA
ncbi:MAG: SRPBCC family protein [Candidatus Eisenbacteria bacterium]|nr:SRPBCC family protein [Candidatus Eisenbacteria bacterium]